MTAFLVSGEEGGFQPCNYLQSDWSSKNWKCKTSIHTYILEVTSFQSGEGKVEWRVTFCFRLCQRGGASVYVVSGVVAWTT